MRNFAKARYTVILHGALRHAHAHGHLILDAILREHWEMIETVTLGFRGSHLLVIKKRRVPLRYYNYHQTEAHNHRLQP